MSNITNIIAIFCKIYLRLYLDYTGTFIRLFPYFFMFKLSPFLYMTAFCVHSLFRIILNLLII